VHAWPYSAHVVPPPVVLAPQVPLDAPVGITQGSPEQQSACEVHAPLCGTHAPSHLLFTQGLPQQSALVTQLSPGFGIFAGSVQLFALSRQRGIPRASNRQQLSGFELQ
jgi:hypothetical protein